MILIHRDGTPVLEIRMDWDIMEIGKHLRRARREITYALIERVHAGVFRGNAKMGATSAFTFGDSFGVGRGMVAVANIRHEYVRPQDWQKEMGCRTGGDKKISKAKASELFPEWRVTNRNADALLIAECARRRVIERGW
jgi:hypothetical protein